MKEPRYSVEVRQNDRRISLDETLEDPFIHTTVYVRGWRQALRVLFRRYTATVVVSADHDIIEQVLELNPDYTGTPGSKRRALWDKEFGAMLDNFASRLPDEP